MNEPPTLREPAGDPGEEFVRDLDVSPFLSVVINDPDSEEILCDWDVPGVDAPRFTCNAEANADFLTTLTLDYDLELDGELVVAHLFDERSQTELSVKFLITVGGEF